MNLYGILEESLREFGSYDCLVDGDAATSSGTLADMAARFADALDRLGVRAGDRVGTVLANRAESFAVDAAVWRLGAVLVPLFPQLGAAELAGRLRHAEAAAVVTTSDLVENVGRAADEVASVRARVAIGPARPGWRSFAALVAEADGVRAPRCDGGDLLATIVYTGGTTGNPKGVMLTHENMLSGIAHHAVRTKRRVSLLNAPLAHIGGMMWGFGYLAMGDRVVLVPSTAPELILRTIERHRVQIVGGPPSMYVAMLALPEGARHDVSSVVRWTYAAGPLSEVRIRQFEARFGGALHAIYGMTETSGIITTTEGHGTARPGSSGKPLPIAAPVETAHLAAFSRRGLDVRIVDGDGRPVADGVEGEICVRGASVSPGYYRMPDETARTFRDGWLHTGDLGVRSTDGELTVRGRRKELIITGGLNVYPSEVEDVVSRAPGVSACAVVGAPNDLTGEEPVAFVVLATGATPAAVAAHCQAQLARYKQPRLEVVAALPVNDVGKIDRVRLARLAAEGGTLEETPLVRRLRSLDPASALAALTEHVVGTLAAVIERSPSELGRNTALMDLGVDSLHAVAFAGALGRSLGRKLSATLVFDQPTLASLARHLGERVVGLRLEAPAAAATAPSVTPRAPRPAPASDEPVAIVGMGVRAPGGVVDPEGLWRVLEHAVDTTSDVPRERWDAESVHDPSRRPGTSVTKRAAFVDDIDAFAARFFGIAPPEAAAMDPQQRLLLETVWQALERAGIAPDRADRERTGVYVGASLNEYHHTFNGGVGYGGGTGAMLSVISGRVSFVLGLRGPALTIDSACSSALAAVHLACQALRGRDIGLAIAAGTNALLSPNNHIQLSEIGAMAPDGRCKTFDASADGYGRSEGVGVVVLKRLSDALADGDDVLAVIRGSALNQDGKSSALTAPHGPAQVALLESALAAAGVAPEEVAYVECHGTGTPLGDPIEVQALGDVLRSDGAGVARRLVLGSAKTNFGHLESAAGLLGIIKATLVLRHGWAPPNLHLRQLNPRIPLARVRALVPTERVPLPRRGRRLVVGVSGFGFSGTNAHVLLEAAPPRPPSPPPARALAVLPLSARSDGELAELSARYAHHLRARPSIDLGDACFTAATGRARFDHRLAVVAGSSEQAADALAATGPVAAVVRGVAPAVPPKVAFLFTGQGSQYVGMARDLYGADPLFRRELDRCAGLLAGELERPLLDVVFARDDGDLTIDDTAFAQPALFAVEWALAAWWRALGVEPAAVLGHSVGELAAATFAGALDLGDALRLVAARGRLMQALPRDGLMLAVQAGEEAVRELVDGQPRVAIAGYNGPTALVLSGDARGIAEIEAALAARRVATQRLNVSHAFHSPLLDPMLEPFERVAATVAHRRPTCALVSNVTGAPLGDAQPLDASYWRRHVREPVRFRQGMEALAASGPWLFVEIGPHPVLLGMARRFLAGEHGWLPSLRQGRGDWAQLCESVAGAWVRGVEIDWRALGGGEPRRKVALPTYPFERQRFWLTPARAAGSETDGRSPLLGDRVVSPRRGVEFVGRLGGPAIGLLDDHRVHGEPILPATAHLELALAGAREALGETTLALADVAFEQALPLSPREPTSVHLVITPDDEGGATFEIATPVADTRPLRWSLHSRGRVVRDDASPSPAPVRLDELRARLPHAVDGAALYARLLDAGLDYGPAFRGVARGWRATAAAGGEALAEIAPPVEAAGPFVANPAIVDACLHALACAGEREGSFLPVGVERLRVLGDVADARASHVRLRNAARPEVLHADLTICDGDGAPLVEIVGLRCQRVAGEALARRGGRAPVEEWIHRQRWKKEAPARVLAAPGRWLVVGGVDGGSRLAAALVARGLDAVHLLPASTTTDALLAALAPHGEAAAIVSLLGADAAKGAAPEDAAERACAATVHLAQAIARAPFARPPRLALVTTAAQAVVEDERVEPAQSALWGLGRVLAIESPELAVRLLDVDARSDDAALVDALLAADDESEIAVRDGARHVARLQPVDEAVAARRSRLARPAHDSFALISRAPGILERLELAPSPREPPGPGEVEVEVRVAGLNFRDVMNALGTYPGGPEPLGNECVGEIVAVGPGVEDLAVGDTVVAGLARGAFRRYLRVPVRSVARKPPFLDEVAAITLPIAFLTADRALRDLAAVRPGERVLVHAGAGGVGQAAIQRARALGAEVFATAGSPRKRAFLRALGVHHVFDSRSAAFAEEIRRATGGAGVDVVLNSLTGEALFASLGLLRPGGRFVEIGKVTILGPSEIPDGVRYFHFDLGDDCQREPTLWRRLFAELVDDVAAGRMRPLAADSFAIEDAVSAFRHMAQARHVGKVVLAVDEALAPRFRCDGSYLVTGGLGGLGLRLARYLVERGAGRVVLVGRRPPTDEAAAFLRALDPGGDRVVVVQGDIAVEHDAARAVAAASSGGRPLAGVFHAAGVLEDAIVARIDDASLARVLGPKVRGAVHLDRLTASLPLDHFVLFSSVSGLLGNGGQGSYAAANAFLDGLARRRRAEGLPALTLQWGSWAEVGMAARAGERAAGDGRGLGTMAPDDALAALGLALHLGVVEAAIAPVDWTTFAERAPHARAPRFGLLARPRPTAATKKSSPAAAPLASRMAGLTDGERRDLVARFLQEQVSATLGVAAEALAPDELLKGYGLDSLLAVELRNRLGVALGLVLPPTTLFEFPTLRALADHLLERFAAPAAAPPASSRAVPAAPAQTAGGVAPSPSAPPDRLAAILASIDALSDEEQRLLADRLLGGAE